MKTFYLDINVAGKFHFLEVSATTIQDAIGMASAFCAGRDLNGDIAKVSQTKTRGQEYVRI